VVFPNFSDQTACAAIFNRGQAEAMILEGFSEEEIGASKLYSALIPFQRDSVDMLAVYLSHDMGLQHQKTFVNKKE